MIGPVLCGPKPPRSFGPGDVRPPRRQLAHADRVLGSERSEPEDDLLRPGRSWPLPEGTAGRGGGVRWMRRAHQHRRGDEVRGESGWRRRGLLRRRFSSGNDGLVLTSAEPEFSARGLRPTDEGSHVRHGRSRPPAGRLDGARRPSVGHRGPTTAGWR